MIVDAHTHVWDSLAQLGPAVAEHIRLRMMDPWDRPVASPAALEEAMQPVDYAFILGLASARLGTNVSNEAIARCVGRQPGKFLGWAGIDLAAPDCLDQLEQARQLGLVGVTLSPAAQGVDPRHERALRLYEACEKAGLPVYFLTLVDWAPQVRMELAQPWLLDPVADQFPSLKMVLSEVGQPWMGQTWTLLAKHEHVYADLAGLARQPWQLYQTLLSAREQGVLHRLLPASGFPFATPQQTLEAIYNVNALTQGTALPRLARQELVSLAERDTLTCLDIPQPARPLDGAEPAQPAADHRSV